jgi:hypothetical protein
MLGNEPKVPQRVFWNLLNGLRDLKSLIWSDNRSEESVAMSKSVVKFRDTLRHVQKCREVSRHFATCPKVLQSVSPIYEDKKRVNLGCVLTRHYSTPAASISGYIKQQQHQQTS